MSARQPEKSCPCGSGLDYQQCCAPLLDGTRTASNAEQLMRSRFTAFSTGKLDYLKSSWHPDFVPRDLQIDGGLTWLDLTVIDFVDGDNEATVEFEARFLSGGSLQGLHERSRFLKQQGRWLYTDGDQLPASFKPRKPGRNEPCPCGSGNKFKRCCG